MSQRPFVQFRLQWSPPSHLTFRRFVASNLTNQ